MTIRNLDSMFDPQSVAVFGASERPFAVGTTVWRNLQAGRFKGRCWAVNPKHRKLAGVPVYADVDSLPEAPDLAVICTPPASVVTLIEQLGRRGTRAAIVMTAGLDGSQRRAILEAARPHLLRILGPNCLGLLAPRIGLNASFAHVDAQPGSLAFVSQSGALVTTMLDWARERGIGFSQFVSLGEHADVDFADMLDYLASDAGTRAILLYIESIDDARKFMSAARAAARNKPVIVVKAGRSDAGQRAAASHTGALAASDLVFDAAIRRAGMLRVDNLQDLFIAAETLAQFSAAPRGEARDQLSRITVLTNGGGSGVLAADAAEHHGIELAPLSAPLLAALDADLPSNWSRGNPVDIIGDAPAARYVEALQSLLADPGCGTLLFIHAPTAIVPSEEIAAAMLAALKNRPPRLLSVWLGASAVAVARQRFHESGIPTYDTPEDAVRACAMLSNYWANQEQLTEAPPARSLDSAQRGFDLEQIRALVQRALAAERLHLSEGEAKELLAACGIPVVAGRTVPAQPAAAAEAAEQIGYPVVLKIVSPQLGHKSDVGGVVLELSDRHAVQAAAEAMLVRVHKARPDAHIEGFSVQRMVRRPRALELIVGASVDRLFGPVILFGQGGTAVEVVADRAIALPPLNAPLARAMIRRTRVSRLLQGWRDVPAADEAAIVAALEAISELLAQVPELAELDINPLLADAQGVIALDARIRLDPARPAGAAHFAIRPYPSELVEQFDWQQYAITLRPIRPEDEAQHLEFLARLDPIDIRMRVFNSRREIQRSELARLTQIDYEREMAFVATAPRPDGGEETLGVARALSDPDNDTAEFGIVVRSDLKGAGLGERLMRKLIEYLRARGTRRLVATVLRENQRMLQLARALDFRLHNDPEDWQVCEIELDLLAERVPPQD